MTADPKEFWTPVKDAVVKAGSLIDGLGASAQKDVFIRIKGGLIQTVSGASPEAAEAKDAAAYINLDDYSVLPAFVDSHVHLCMSSNLEGEDRRRRFFAGFDECRPVIGDHIAQTLAAGVLSVRDGGDAVAHTTRYKLEYSDHHPDFFRIMTAGRAWHKSGRYGRIVGGEPLPGENGIKAIEKQLAATDQIKLINSGLNSLTKLGRQTKPQFSIDELKAIVQSARKNKRRVMVHANGEAPVKEALAAGVNSIEHGFFMGRDNLTKMAEKDIFWVPTIGALSAFLKLGRDSGGVVARTVEDQLRQMAWARQAGTRIALGTDAGSPGMAHGQGVAKELSLLLDAGYTVEEAARCATANGAELLGLSDRGALIPGKLACFIAVPGGKDDLVKNLSKLRLFVAVV